MRVTAAKSGNVTVLHLRRRVNGAIDPIDNRRMEAVAPQGMSVSD
jgi:hypothetical protein